MTLRRLTGKLGRREREQIREIDRDRKTNNEEENERELKVNCINIFHLSLPLSRELQRERF